MNINMIILIVHVYPGAETILADALNTTPKLYRTSRHKMPQQIQSECAIYLFRLQLPMQWRIPFPQEFSERFCDPYMLTFMWLLIVDFAPLYSSPSTVPASFASGHVA